MKIVYRIDIAAPADMVFCWMTQRDKVMQWVPSLLDSAISQDSADRIGTTLRQVYEARGRRVEMPMEVIAYEPNRWVVVRTKTQKQDTTFDYRVHRLERGTQLTAVINIHFLGFMKIVGFLAGESIRDRVSRSCAEDFSRLKRLCEQGCAS